MSIVTATQRVSEIQQLLNQVAHPTAAPSGTGFGAQLAQATAAAAPAAGAVGTGPVPYSAEIDAAAAKYSIDPALLKGLIRQESNFNPAAGSPAGAQGLTQLMPGTASSLGVTDVHDPAQSIDGGAHYLRDQLDAFGGDVAKALAAYNAGPGAVTRYGGVPPYAETQSYVKNVMSYADQYRAAAPTAVTAPAATIPTTIAGATPSIV